MILEIFVLLLFICAFLAWFGYYSKIRAFAVVAFSILFILGAWIILYDFSGRDSMGLQYQSGSVINDSSPTTTIITNVYTTYNDQTTFWVGFLLSIISAVGIFLVATNNIF